VGSMDEAVKGEVGFWAGGVEDAGDVVLGAVEEECGEIARVDKADKPGGWFGDYEFVLRREHPCPPGDAIGGIVRSGDDAWAGDAVGIGEGVDDDLFAEDF